MKIEQITTLSAGRVSATVTAIEEQTNDFGESVVFFFTVKDKEGTTIEGMRLYCTAIISKRSKLGKLCRDLEPDAKKLNVATISDTKELNVLVGKTTDALRVYENDAGYMRLKF